MFSTLLLYFILFKIKRYFGEETANMIVAGLLSDEDDTSSNESHLSSDSYSESAYSDSSETDEDFNHDTFVSSRIAKVWRTIRTRGGIRRQSASAPDMQNVIQASDPQELQQ